ncbi:hypothetical protein Tco_1097832 [Tanacetum coccineum]
MMKLLSLINEKPSLIANMSGIKPNFYNDNVFFNLNFEKFLCTKSESIMYNVILGWITDSGANQDMTDSTKDMFNVVDISNLMLIVGHPNGTLAKVTAIGSLRLTSGIVLFDVFIVPEYNVSLLYVNKMIKDSKFSVGFDEYKCYIQNLKLGKIVGIGSETGGGLYLFDVNKNGKLNSSVCNNVFVCHVSSELWHGILGHPVDQGKQTREPFLLSDHKSESVGDIVHCDVWGPYKVVSRDGNSQNGEDPTNVLKTSPVLRRSSRQRNMPSKLNDFVIGSSVKYDLEKYVKALNLEMEALHRNNTYVLADLPPGRKVIRCDAEHVRAPTPLA